MAKAGLRKNGAHWLVLVAGQPVIRSLMVSPPTRLPYPPFTPFATVAVPFGPCILKLAPASRNVTRPTAGSTGGGNCRKGGTEELFNEGANAKPWKLSRALVGLVPIPAATVSLSHCREPSNGIDKFK